MLPGGGRQHPDPVQCREAVDGLEIAPGHDLDLAGPQRGLPGIAVQNAEDLDRLEEADIVLPVVGIAGQDGPLARLERLQPIGTGPIEQSSTSGLPSSEGRIAAR